MIYLAYHNDPAQKAERVKQANWHKAHDLIAQGSYYDRETHQVCAIACSLPREVLKNHKSENWHTLQAEHTGISPVLSLLHDKLFEAVKEGCIEFAPKVFETLQVGADTQCITWTFMYELLSSELIQEHVRYNRFTQQREAINEVRKALLDAIQTGAMDKAAKAAKAAVAAFKDIDKATDKASVKAAYAAYAAANAAEARVNACIQMRDMLLDIQANWGVPTQQYTKLTPIS